ncbi:recombinase family protein [Planococcus sp. ISL-110]|uniref:recombinase family protein n=1 Tax=Planococcus sp. ISL-110 TaxID=2819167 RepID=UPI001BE995E9|nr:recombinase family protein [Planococcus sp. ISL-110]MBT2569063.1 recombinase family protein [Planococcus sp. ISL-110]
MIIGYARPTEKDVNCKNQISLLEQYGCTDFYIEEHPSPQKRVQLIKMMSILGENDLIIVEKLHSFADSTRHLVELLNELNRRKAFLLSLKEGIDTRKPMDHSFLEIVQSIVELQSDTISQKTKIGMNEAKQKGIVSGRPRKPDENIKKAIEMYNSKQFNLAEIKEKTGISKSTLYRYLEN